MMKVWSSLLLSLDSWRGGEEEKGMEERVKGFYKVCERKIARENFFGGGWNQKKPLIT